MFTTVAQPSPSANLFSLPPQPLHPPPLNPRHAKRPRSHSYTTMANSKPESQMKEHVDDNKKNRTSSPSLSRQSYAERYASQIRWPPAQIVRQHASREKQRDMFLNKVKRSRDEGRFEARSDQMQMINYLVQQRRYQEEIERSAPDFGEMMEEVEGGEGLMGFEDGQGVDPRWGSRGDEVEAEERILEEFISQEEQYQAFLEELESSRETEQQLQPCPPSSHYDDEDYYETIFADLIDNGHGQAKSSGKNDNVNDGMDTSQG
ncbi:hypothetical protein PAAG_02063 [Paracoccidioides lutzii Pb01]|uniref:Uncharacterized protein n=1 Tax=Paracoccidioides lutzii (strain ATCC MYA-826 / Pb01) TaxID=502779 RepID=C1GU68_PARBA|nr:hypothetical protein PAAG_02063 [Paracoccidioides lutzii Pb01]EEH39874.2 hypothetical protein PAAG_02063 [Paracoccidioides lutzii Pb01]